jgi:hypothetical protein
LYFDPLLLLRVVRSQQFCGIAGDHAERWKAPCNNGIRSNDTVPANRQFTGIAKNNSPKAQPAIFFDRDSSAFRHALLSDGLIYVGELMVVIHDQDGWGKENVLFQRDLISR